MILTMFFWAPSITAGKEEEDVVAEEDVEEEEESDFKLFYSSYGSFNYRNGKPALVTNAVGTEVGGRGG